ncbi:MAG: ParB/RepB/Spo0J family partition protein [Candidatus Bathyarchaeia archaeon]
MERPEEIPVERITVSRDLLRDINETIVSELAKSIQSNGLLQPILVRPRGRSYEAVFGHHRLEACRRLDWKSIPAIVKEMSADDSFLVKLVENLQRNVEINPLAEAQGYIKLINNGWTINAIASKIGKSDSYVSDRIGLVRRLHPTIVKRIKEKKNGYLKPSHCELLARLGSKQRQLQLSELVERRRLSVRRLERMITGDLPYQEIVKEKGGNLFLALPQELAKLANIVSGSSVYVYLQSRKRITIESAMVQLSCPPLGRMPTDLHKGYVTVRAPKNE